MHQRSNIRLVIFGKGKALKADCPPFVKALKPKHKLRPLTDIKAYILPSAKRQHLFHTSADRPLLRHYIKNLLADIHQGIFIGGISSLSPLHQRKGIFAAYYKSARFLATKAKADLRPLAEVSAEAGMVGAYPANRILAKFKNYLAKIILIEEGAALILSENEMGLALIAYAAAKLVPKSS